jgi:glycosyltransferase involved in cell wall biosynthesis
MMVDAKIVPKLAAHYSIDWILIRTRKSQRTTDGLIVDTVVPREYCLNYRQRDPRVITQYLSLLLSIRHGDYDLVYNSFHGLPYFYPILSVLLDRNNLIYATHNVHIPKGASNEWAMRTYHRYIYAATKHFHVFSKYQLRTIAHLLPGKRHYYAPIGLDGYGSSTVRPPKDTIRILFFGYIRRYKRLDLLLEAFRTITAAGVRNVELVIAGKCDEWERYRSLINDDMRVDVRPGIVANKDIPDLVSSCHYLILPYQDATQSGVLSLAYHYDKPVITSDIEAFADEVIPHYTGYVFTQQSHDSLVSVLRSVVSEHDAIYETLTRNVLEFGRSRSLDSIVAAYRLFLDNALEGSGREPATLTQPTAICS